MTRFKTFERDIRLATSDLEPEAVNAELARFARAELARAISTGEGSPVFDRFVNGRANVAEELVEAPGPILYVFNRWQEIIEAALEELVEASPVRSGRYARSFIVLVNQQVRTSFNTVPADAEVIITNVQPYTRKIFTGAMRTSLPARNFDKAKTRLLRRVGRVSVSAQVRFLDIGAGVHSLVPYRLRRNSKRKDRAAGQKLTYPSLVLNLPAV